MITRKHRGNNRRFLEAILPKLVRRCEERILNTTWEVNIFDEHMLPLILFNGPCWLSNCSLADVAKATLSIIECADIKPVVIKEIGRKWREAKVYLN